MNSSLPNAPSNYVVINEGKFIANSRYDNDSAIQSPSQMHPSNLSLESISHHPPPPRTVN